jgi:hypothetical protein
MNTWISEHKASTALLHKILGQFNSENFLANYFLNTQVVLQPLLSEYIKKRTQDRWKLLHK